MSLITRLHLLPIIVSLWFPGTFVITYIIAVNLGDVLPIFPYISDTGTFSPESCIFGQMLNTGAVLMAIMVYVRYREIEEIEKTGNYDNVKIMNKRSVWLGVAASFGVSIVGNFQETNAFVIHVLGAGLAFGVGTIYICMQTLISFRLQQNSEQNKINKIRAILCAICVIGFGICSLSGLLSLMQFKGKDITKWSKEDGGYHFHLTSTISEWIIAISLMGFLLTYTDDFRKIAFEEPVICVDSRKGSTKIFPQQAPVQTENERF